MPFEQLKPRREFEEEKKSLNEECGVFGVWNHPEANTVTYFGLHALQHRGQEGAGITTATATEFKNYRGHGLLNSVFKNPENLANLTGNRAIGHVRYSTSGATNSLVNVQPFMFHFYDQDISLAHNGNLTNAKTLRRHLEKEGAVFQSSSDSEVLVHLIRHSSALDFHGKLEDALRQLRGGFNYVILTNDELIGVVDPNSFRPLVLGQMRSGAYVISSETCALHSIGAEFVRNIHAGHYVSITDEGYTLHQYSAKTQVALESMEYIYFARPDSDIAGINVHSARKSLGRKLAQERPCPQADMVIGVPNSSLSAASGYAEESGLPYEMGLVKNQYVARTFIEPTQELREQGVRKKLSAVVGVVKDKSIVLVDDSIVRGTTSRRLIKLLREAGAREIHLRISSPPLRFPNFYGIDMSTSSELLAANMTVPEMRDYLGCDSLGFMTVDGLVEAIGTQFDAPHKGLCVDAFTGDYPAPLCDYQERFEEQLTDIQRRVLRGENVDE
ncbi:amidophosphoribosyltransferase [Vaginisenegalia massiliensis]|uniref:amidophosphoribosyltransferase n=1 Tax=Vaginisenegalia massiliensis TaxID=2058294 RepID=UPI000F521C42|nr:amidophosphoribosyltransferase [Vaginisenegalia massiliensis]